jgi:four helix bundle protein
MRIEDLQVYQKLFKLALETSERTMKLPKFEMYELGSQLRRSSNSAPANLAECFGNKHTNIYAEGISRAQGEIRETVHHLSIASNKKYLSKDDLKHFADSYEECSKMLYGLEKAIYKKSMN